MNLLTKFHEDWKINVASRVLTRKNAPPPGGHVFQPSGIIFKLFQDIIGMNLLTKKNAPPLGSHVFQAKFHEDRKINVLLTGIIFEHVQDIIGMNLLTMFHEDQTINVAFRVLTRFYYSHIRKNAPPLGSHVFQASVTIFELNCHIQNTHVLTKFHEDWTKNVTSRRKLPRPPGGNVFSPIWTIFELVQDINETNVSTKFHDDWAKIVTSRVFIRNTALPPGGHVFQQPGTIIELNQNIIKTNILTKLHEDLASNVTSTVFTTF
ncbi:hypothetical protein DPMN_175765 [Dreissena polymorpha]|uniref:Uncharacterized protein n=1 Tax=Dreissena polymorpha TaxID=45954 RepID=A0A9D4E778_DREPO|nr:hypothetical protein DPMN_175765 [Dreissena polymorpha]